MTGLGDFCKFLVTNFPTKVVQIFGDFLNILKIITSLWLFFENFELLFIPISGHTDCSVSTRNFLGILKNFSNFFIVL